jgi:drug/metabolite transporter (DMT)-like permease
MIGEIASFSNALGNALTNVLGGKSTQLGSWRNTLRFSSSIAMVILTLVILFNLNTITLNVVLLGVVAGFCGGSGLPFIYKAFSIGSVSFVSPVVALVQSFNLILFGVIVKNEDLSWSFPIASLLAVIGLFLASKSSATHQRASFKVFGLTCAAAFCFTGFSLLMTEIDQSQIIAALFGARIGVVLVSIVFSPKSEDKKTGSGWKRYALLSGTFEVVANLLYMIAITNLELSKVGVFMASAPALSALIAIKLLKQRPSISNWLGIAATSSALALIAVS